MSKNDRTNSLYLELKQQFFRKNKLRFLLTLTVSLISAGNNLFMAWLLKELVDITASHSEALPLQQVVLMLIACFLIFLITDSLTAYLQPKFTAQGLRRYKNLVFAKLLNKNIAGFKEEATATYLSALSNDCNSIEMNYLENIFPICTNILQFSGALIMMLYHSPLLTLISVISVMLPLLSSIFTGQSLTKAEQTVSQQNELFVAGVKDSLNGHSVIKSFHAEPAMLEAFRNSNEHTENTKCHRNRLAKFIALSGQMTSFFTQMTVFVVAAYMVVAGYDISPGTVLIFVQLMNFVLAPIATLPGIFARSKAALGLIKKMADILQRSVKERGTEITPVLDNSLTVNNVSFAYPTSDEAANTHLALRNFSYKFEKGKSYALVGASGSGKSTLLNLFMGAYDNYGGSINIDEHELMSVSTKSLYKLISFIQQEVFIFDASIKDNITLFRDFSEAEIAKAVADAGLQELIASRGGDYRCGENGNALSGGERQRISIARCLLRKTPVLLVDEATSALDKVTANHITQTILQLKDILRLVVTHSLEADILKQFDTVLVLKNGELIEAGSFDELMAAKAYFYSLYTVTQ